MQKALIQKIFFILFISVAMAVVLGMIRSTINERSEFHDQAIQSIAADSVHEQSVIGPLLVIPYNDDFDVTEQTTVDNKQQSVLKHQTVSRLRIVYPDNLNIAGNVTVEQRYRGIHKVPVYTGDHDFSGTFAVPKLTSLDRSTPNSHLTVGQPYLALAIDDVRGLHQIPTLSWDGAATEFQQGTAMTALPNGIHAAINTLDLNSGATANFNFKLKLDGIKRLAITPVGKNNEITLRSPWPHPEFSGRFLPSASDRVIDANGFNAKWNIPSLATNVQPQLTAMIEDATGKTNITNNMLANSVDNFDVNFIEPINIYSQSDRAIKYGLLFVGLTFAAFFLFEILKRLPIHPVQYSLVGFSLALFFLLLISLSEHLPFVTSYLAAAFGCVILNGFYLSYVLRNWLRGFGFGSALAVLYGALYGLLQSENNALLMGSLLLFALLAAAMIATRNIDWYQIGKTSDGDNTVTT